MFLKKINKKTKNGFSLLETLIYVAIFSIFIVGVTSLIITSLQNREHNIAIQEVGSEGERLIKIITQAIRNADAIDSPVPNASDGSLVLSTLNPATDPITFSLNSGVLYISEAGGAPIAISNNKVNVTSVQYSSLSRATTPGVVMIRITLESVAEISQGNRYSSQFYGSASIRK